MTVLFAHIFTELSAQPHLCSGGSAQWTSPLRTRPLDLRPEDLKVGVYILSSPEVLEEGEGLGAITGQKRVKWA